ncbi:MAG: hypothetical protein QM684_18400 [Rhizobium sp.]
MNERHADRGLEALPHILALVWPLHEREATLRQALHTRLLDRLGSAWGRGRSFYQAGPFLADSHVSAGWQDARCPRDLAIAFLGALDEKSQALSGKLFQDLDVAVAQTVLQQTLETEAPRSDAAIGFGVLRHLIYDALFVDSWEHPALGWDWLDFGGRQSGRA